MFAGESRRNLILEAAAELFSEKGFHKTTVEEIANLAGVGKGTVYEYFPSKKAILRELLFDSIDYYFNQFAQQVVGDLTLKEKLQNMTRAHFQFFLEHRNLARIVLYEHRQITEDLDSVMLEREQERTAYVESLLQEGIEKGEIRQVDIQLAARTISGALWNMGMDLIISAHVLDQEQLVEGVVDILWNGLEN